MSLFAKLFNKNTGEVSSKNVEDFVSLTRVYFQSVIAANLGITNIRFVPHAGRPPGTSGKGRFAQDADAGLRHQ